MNNPAPSRPAPALDALRTTAALLLILFFTLLAYTFLHESGHLMTGLLFGGQVTSFSVNFFNLSAHVGLDGAFTPTQNAVISAAGVLFALLVWAGFILLVPRRGVLLLEFLKLTVSMGFINSLLAWIVIPFLVLAGQRPGDDSVNFLGYTGFSPVLVSLAALLIYLGAWALFLLRMPGGPRGLIQHLRAQRLEFAPPQARRTLAGLVLAGLLFAGGAFGLSQAFGSRPRAVVPADYTQVGSYDLSQSSFVDASVYTLDLSQPAQVSFFIAMTDIQGAPLKIHLSGPDGYDNVFFAVSDPQFKGIGLATVHPRDLPLAPGQYQLRLTFPPGRGKIEIFVR